MFAFQDTLHCFPERFAPVHGQNALIGDCLFGTQKLHGTGIAGKELRLFVDDQKALTHVVGNDSKFFLLAFGIGKLLTDRLLLFVDPGKKRRDLIISIIHLGIIQIQTVQRLYDLFG